VIIQVASELLPWHRARDRRSRQNPDPLAVSRCGTKSVPAPLARRDAQPAEGL